MTVTFSERLIFAGLVMVVLRLAVGWQTKEPWAATTYQVLAAQNISDHSVENLVTAGLCATAIGVPLWAAMRLPALFAPFAAAVGVWAVYDMALLSLAHNNGSWT